MLPCGLGSRDTLRTEMGYPLHGQDITLDVTPTRPGSAGRWAGRRTPSGGATPWSPRRRPAPARLLRGLVAVGRGIPRPGMSVSLTHDVPLCDITSGTFSATLKKGIGLALVPTMVGSRGARWASTSGADARSSSSSLHRSWTQSVRES